jgi:TolB-like protein/class 3 adenylate cyclase/Tfp pilus assembly protein PilF
LERKLTAILCADVFGYSRLMGEDEEATLHTLSSHRKLIDSLIEQHHGRFVNSAGDSVLAEFASVVNAVQCAVEIQTTLKTENANIPPERRMEFRIGVNLGDVMVDGEQIYGDGVNVAARLESLAAPGGICISHTVHDQVKNKLALNYEDLGPQTVKNIAEPVRVFRVMLEGAARTAIRPTERSLRKHWRGGAFSLVGLAIIVGTIVLVQHLSLRPPTTTASIPSAQSPALTLPDKPSIAVLPFANMSGDREQEYFSDGITDDIIAALSRLPGLFVIDRNSTFTYKGKPVKAQQVSRELGVYYVLEGSVRKEADQVRITAQLVDATSGADLWAVRYDRPMRDIFSLQDEIVRRIVTTLNLQLDLMQRGADVRQTTDNLDAYDDYLRGLDYRQTLSEDGNAKARQMFEKAIVLDPKYAQAYAYLGLTYWLDWVSQWTHDPHTLDRAFQLGQQAIALDDSLPRAHMIMGLIYLLKKQYDQAIAEAERAIALDPNSAVGYRGLAEIMDFSGKPAEAVGLAEKAMRLDPRNRDLYLFFEGEAYNQMGRYQEAIPILKRHLARYPNTLGAHEQLIVDYTELGREDEARAAAAEVLRISPQFSVDADMQILPFKDPAWRKRFYADMRKAGLK